MKDGAILPESPLKIIHVYTTVLMYRKSNFIKDYLETSFLEGYFEILEANIWLNLSIASGSTDWMC